MKFWSVFSFLSIQVFCFILVFGYDQYQSATWFGVHALGALTYYACKISLMLRHDLLASEDYRSGIFIVGDRNE